MYYGAILTLVIFLWWWWWCTSFHISSTRYNWLLTTSWHCSTFWMLSVYICLPAFCVYNCHKNWSSWIWVDL